MTLFLLFSIIGLGAVTSIARKEYLKRSVGGLLLYNGLVALFAAIFFVLTSIGNLNFKMEFVPYSIGFGISYLCADLFAILAVATGPLALSSLLISYSLILPALYGIVFLNEPMTTPMIIAIILLLISATLTNLEGKQEKKRITPKWMIFVLLSFLGNGSCSIIQKMEQIRFNGGYKNEFMIIALLLVFVFIFGAALITERGNLRKNAPAAIICSAAAGLTNGGVNLLVMVLTGLMATSIMFPAISAGGIIVTFLIALLIYKEKLSVYQYLGALFGIAAIILFNI